MVRYHHNVKHTSTMRTDMRIKCELAESYMCPIERFRSRYIYVSSKEWNSILEQTGCIAHERVITSP